MSSLPRAISVNALRTIMGLVGLSLPIGLSIYSIAIDDWQVSISGYYYTSAGDFFVGALMAISIILIAYYGYDEGPNFKWIGDRTTALLAALGAAGTAIFPTNIREGYGRCLADMNAGPCELRSECDEAVEGLACTVVGGETGPFGKVLLPFDDLITGWVGDVAIFHLAATILLLLMFANFCLVLFPMGPKSQGGLTGPRAGELAAYYACGTVMIGACICLIAEFFGAFRSWETSAFWFEAVAIVAFSIAWLIYGDVLAKGNILGFRQPEKFL